MSGEQGLEVVTQMALSSKQVSDQVQRIQEVMAAVMKEGEHYGKIPGCGPKPTLLKAGAEKLANTFRLSPDYSVLSEIESEDFISYKMKCTLTHIPTGLVAAHGVGSCNSREKKYIKLSAWDIQNTLVKMACKRALVAAVLNATAASDIFTQDLEDMTPRPVQEAPNTSQAQPKKKEAPAESTSAADVISEAQAKRMWAIAKNAGFNTDQIAEHLEKTYGVKHSREIKRADYDKICAYLQGIENA